MIAYYTWTNTQIVNAANSKINIFKNDKADLYVRMSEQISEPLLRAVKSQDVFENIYYIDPIILDYKKLLLGFLPNIRAIFLESAYKKAYGAMLNNMCGEREYSRVILPWFYADSVFLIYYWDKFSPNLRISFLEEGTGGYCCYKKEMIFLLAPLKTLKEKFKRILAEGKLSYKYAGRVDSICLYRPQYCREDIDYQKYSLPVIDKAFNPIMYQILFDATDFLEYTHFVRYSKRNIYYFSTYSVEGRPYDDKSVKIIRSAISVAGEKNVLVKVHTNNSGHARTFARSVENLIFVDREKYIFEGLYVQIPNRENKVMISVASTTALYPKFMFNEEPYIILTYRLYDTYRQVGIERDDRIAGILLDAYSDKSRIMIPNSMYELKTMLASILGKSAYCIDEVFDESLSHTEDEVSETVSDQLQGQEKV